MKTLFCFSVFALLAFAASATNPGNVVKYLQREVKCRLHVTSHDDLLFLIAAIIYVVLSCLLLAVSILYFHAVVRKASEHVKAAEEKANLVMDAVLVALVPVEVLKRIGSYQEDKTDKKKNRARMSSGVDVRISNIAKNKGDLDSSLSHAEDNRAR